MYQEVGLGSKTAWMREIDVRIANPAPPLLAKCTANQKGFFYDYASFVVRLLQDKNVAGRIHQVLSAEKIVIDKPVDVRVMVFPARTFRGRQNRILHGSYNETASQISLYPLRISREWIREEGTNLFRSEPDSLSQRKLRVLYEISESAVSSMIHDILHVKAQQRGMSRYGEEALVRKLERQFMQEWADWIKIPVQRALLGIR